MSEERKINEEPNDEGRNKISPYLQEEFATEEVALVNPLRKKGNYEEYENFPNEGICLFVNVLFYIPFYVYMKILCYLVIYLLSNLCS